MLILLCVFPASNSTSIAIYVPVLPIPALKLSHYFRNCFINHVFYKVYYIVVKQSSDSFKLKSRMFLPVE